MKNKNKTFGATKNNISNRRRAMITAVAGGLMLAGCGS
jgi:hypothetical protein